jgi:hypothetical protein
MPGLVGHARARTQNPRARSRRTAALTQAKTATSLTLRAFRCASAWRSCTKPPCAVGVRDPVTRPRGTAAALHR